MAVLVTCKNKEDLFKMKAQEWSQHFSHYKSGDFSRHSRAANSTVPGWILLNLEPIQDFYAFLITCNDEEDPIKSGGARVLTRFTPL